MSESSRWEYRVETLGSFWSGVKDEDINAALDEWGEEGWEVFFVHQPVNSNKVRIVGKRPLSSTSSRRKRSWPGA